MVACHRLSSSFRPLADLVRPVVAVGKRAGSKDSLTNAHCRSSFFNGQLEISRHAHGELIKAYLSWRALAQLIAQGAQLREASAYLRRVIGKEGQCHQASDSQGRKSWQLLQKGTNFSGWQAVLAAFSGRIHLHQNV